MTSYYYYDWRGACVGNEVGPDLNLLSSWCRALLAPGPVAWLGFPPPLVYTACFHGGGRSSALMGARRDKR